MPNFDNSQLNLIRNYRFTFYDIIGDGDKQPFQYSPLQGAILQNSVNFSFTYSITNNFLNTAKFMFYNLSENAINLFASQKNRRGFNFETWYSNQSTGNKTIFNGLTYTVNTYRQGVDTITEVVGCDVFLNLMYKPIVQSYPAGTSYLNIVNNLISHYGSLASLSALSRQYLTGVYKSPKTFKGQLLTILNMISADAGLIFSIQLGKIFMIPQKLNIPTSNDVPVINAHNGLVGQVRSEALSLQLFPVTFFDNQNLDQNLSIITVNTLLKPYLIYDKIRIESQRRSGLYGILSITYSGEWRGNPWYTTLKLWPDTTNT